MYDDDYTFFDFSYLFEGPKYEEDPIGHAWSKIAQDMWVVVEDFERTRKKYKEE